MRRFFLSTVLSLLATVMIATPAAASRSWCARDPIVTLNDAPLQVWVAIPDEYVPAVDGPVEVSVKAPDGVEGEIIFTDEGFNGHGEVVTFTTLDDASIAADGSFLVQVRVDIPLDRDILRELGVESGQIPFQLTAIVGGELVVNRNDKPKVVGGDVHTAEGTNDGTSLRFGISQTP
jgi:hypothetical protein